LNYIIQHKINHLAQLVQPPIIKASTVPSVSPVKLSLGLQAKHGVDVSGKLVAGKQPTYQTPSSKISPSSIGFGASPYNKFKGTSEREIIKSSDKLISSKGFIPEVNPWKPTKKKYPLFTDTKNRRRSIIMYFHYLSYLIYKLWFNRVTCINTFNYLNFITNLFGQPHLCLLDYSQPLVL